MQHFRVGVVFVFYAFWQNSAFVTAAEPMTLLLEAGKPSSVISPTLLGLSYETSVLLRNSDGVHYFRGENQPLLATFKTLGVRSLRIGGNSVDAAGFAGPGVGDLRDFLDFAKAAGVKVIYSVRLKEPSPSGAAGDSTGNRDSAESIAHFIHGYCPEVVDCFAIGNEPSYMKDYSVYSAHWQSIRDAIVAVYPEATFCGPDQDPSPELDKHMAVDFGSSSGRLVRISQHSYPFGCSFKNPKAKDDVSKLIPVDAGAAREKMLSPAAYAIYQKIYDGIASSISGTSVAYGLTETNSFWFSGSKGASDSYASALWAVDYLHWWAAREASNIDFHTGDRTGGEVTLPCQYAAFVTSGEGYEVRPLGYGMKLFDLGGHGRIVPIENSSAEKQILCKYATLSEEKVVSITLINKSHGASAESIDVQIKSDVPFNAPGAEVIYLRGKNDDISGGAGDVTLGDAPIKADGTWNGHWTPLRLSADSSDVISVSIPPASAAVVRVGIR